MFETGNPYKRFSEFVRFTSRHVLNEENRRFLELVVATSRSRKRRMKAGTRLWRAQTGHIQGKLPVLDEVGKELRSPDFPFPFDPKRMIPLANRAHEGRVNPKGIPCLYVSEDMHTAMTEVRPWIGSYVSVCELEVKRDMVVVDCMVDGGLPRVTIPEGTPDERERFVWWCMNYAFSEPVTRSDDTADYAPTQVIAEAFRQDGSDGLVYGSTLGTGRTVAMFDLEAANVGKCRVYRVDEVKLKFTDWTAD
jgi:RES domain